MYSQNTYVTTCVHGYEHVSLPAVSTHKNYSWSDSHCAYYDISSGDESLEFPLDITEYVDGLTSYILTVTAINCNGQTATVCVYASCVLLITCHEARYDIV